MNNKLKHILKKYFTSLAFFYSHLRYRIIILLVVSILVGLMDGLGLTMFLPLLELVANQESSATAENLGSLAFVVEGIQNLGLTLNLTVVLLTILFFFTLKGFFKWLEQYLTVVYQQFFIRKIRVENIDALARFRYDLFVNSDAGRIQNTMSGEVGRVVNAYRSYSRMLQQLVLVVTYSFLAFLANPEFAALVAVGGLVTNLLFNALYKKTKQLSKKLTSSNHDFQGLLIQQVAFFKYLKATGLIRKYAKNLKEKVRDIEQAQRSIGVLNSLIQGVREPLLIGVVVIVILVQVNWMGGSLGLIILSILFFYRALTSVMLLQTMYNNFLSFTGSLTNLTEFTKELEAGYEPQGNYSMGDIQQGMELRDVSYAYDSTPVLQNVSFTFRKKETLAIVGESGSGKTTLMNVMSGLLEPQSGELRIDGVNIRDIDKVSLQNRIGYITQEPVIFDDTIFNNVTFWAGKTPENLDRFERALRQASIWAFVQGLREQEDARLGNNGINLSGGQKQRISIARELYKEVDYLFMDEATSALDSETEKAIQENIDLLRGKYSILIIAHRLSTIKNADRVIVLKEGKMEEKGSYEDLISRSVSFQRMVELQEL